MHTPGLYKQLLIFIALTALTAILPGCAHVSLNDQNNTFQPASGSAIFGGTSTDVSTPGFAILANQVLKGPRAKVATLNVSNQTINYDINDERPLPEGLKGTAVVRKLLLSRERPEPMPVSLKELKQFSEKLLTSLQDIHNDSTRQKKIAASRAAGQIRFDSVLLAYLQDYFEGDFVRRQGIVLGKPTIKAEVKEGKFSGGIDNDTLTGLLTVFLEAFFDFICPTPVYIGIDPVVTWKESHQPTGNNDSAGKQLYILFFVQETGPEFLTASGKEPTCAKHKVVPVLQVVPEGSTGITKTKLKYITLAASLSSEQSKHLAALLVKSLGKVNLGWVIEGGFSIGDNNTLTKLVETFIETATRRSLEYALIEFFKDYDPAKKGNDAVNDLLTNIKSQSSGQ